MRAIEDVVRRKVAAHPGIMFELRSILGDDAQRSWENIDLAPPKSRTETGT
jgi:hypothetical protein